jgi:hypothetical protein
MYNARFMQNLQIHPKVILIKITSTYIKIPAKLPGTMKNIYQFIEV